MDGMDGWGVRRSDGFRGGQGCLGFWGLGVAALGNMEGCAWRWMAKTSLGTLFLAPLSVVQYLHYTVRRCHAMPCHAMPETDAMRLITHVSGNGDDQEQQQHLTAEWRIRDT